MNRVREMRERLEAASSLAEAQEALTAEFEPLGFELHNYVAVRPPAGRRRMRVLSSLPPGWVDRYVDLDYGSIDATFPAAGEAIFPVRWDAIYADGRTSKRQRHIFDEAKEFGLKQGITVPIHGPAGGIASLNLSGDLPSRDFESIWTHLHDELKLIAAYFHSTILKISDLEDSYEPINLTDRERETLVWTSCGKTAWEIGEILHISEGTVIFHLNNAMRKLQVFSKHHAVVKAIMLGLIAPEV